MRIEPPAGTYKLADGAESMKFAPTGAGNPRAQASGCPANGKDTMFNSAPQSQKGLHRLPRWMSVRQEYTRDYVYYGCIESKTKLERLKYDRDLWIWMYKKRYPPTK
jgi:hypothetical protein